MLLSLDVGFRGMGWCVFHKGSLKGLGVILTEKEKRKNIRVADDNIRNAIKIANRIGSIIRKYKIKGIIGETPSGGSQNARASHQMGIAVGIVSSICALYDLPNEWCIPQDLKKAVTGNRKASKDQIMDRIAELEGWEKEVKKKSIIYHTSFESFNKKQFEHIADAYGAYLTLKNDNLVRMFG